MLTRICDICGEPMIKHGDTTYYDYSKMQIKTMDYDYSKMQIKMRNADGKFKKIDVCYRCACRIEAFCKRKGDDSNREL